MVHPMPLRRLFFLILGAALLVAGCMDLSSTLTVRPDGSGTLTERFVVDADMARMMQGLASVDSMGTAQDPFSGARMRAEADSLPGLRLQSFTRIDDTTSRGYEATYRFENLNDVPFDPGPDDLLSDEEMGPTGDGPLDLMSAMRFEFTPGAPATLTIHLPFDTAEVSPDATMPGATPDDEDPPSEAEMEMMRAMMADAGFRIAVTIDGEIMETNATHRDGATITLLEMDFDTLARDSAAFREMMRMSSGPTSPDASIDRLNSFPGMTVEPRETVTVRFR
jgi:hypothetical protein